ncbi:unnamed protein product [Closterium sp. NIES-54]
MRLRSLASTPASSTSTATRAPSTTPATPTASTTPSISTATATSATSATASSNTPATANATATSTIPTAPTPSIRTPAAAPPTRSRHSNGLLSTKEVNSNCRGNNRREEGRGAPLKEGGAGSATGGGYSAGTGLSLKKTGIKRGKGELNGV